MKNNKKKENDKLWKKYKKKRKNLRSYKNKDNKSNIVTPLPPAEEGPGARVGYYRSEPNMLAFSIPDNENILY